MKSNRLSLVNEKLKEHDMKILFDGKFYRVQSLGVRGYSSNDTYPYNFSSIQSALDYITPLIRVNVTEY